MTRKEVKREVTDKPKKCQREKGDSKREKTKKLQLRKGKKKKGHNKKQAQEHHKRRNYMKRKGEKTQPQRKKYNHWKKSMRGLQQRANLKNQEVNHLRATGSQNIC